MTDLVGRVIAASADEYIVDVETELLRCTLRGAMWQERGRDDAALVVVGDHVRVEPAPEEQGVIHEVLSRRNVLGRGREFHTYGAKGHRQRRGKRAVRRRSEQILASNVDQAMLVFAASSPRPNFGKVDQLVIAALSEDLPTILCINKMDIAEPELLADLRYYEQVPAKVAKVSAVAGDGVEALRAAMEGQTTLLWGPSGVGKSTLINAMWPEVGQKVGHVSAMTGMGTHTTRAVEMLRAGEDTWVIDTPGWRHFALLSASQHAIDAVLWDVAELAAQCRFDDCRHDREPGCVVQEALDEERLSPRRVDLYRELSEQMAE